MHGALTTRQRWTALVLLCLGELMIVLDSTVVNVALPSIRDDLGFRETALVWVVNAYMLTYGGFMLLGGRLGDLYGQRKVFLWGLVAFTLASAACGVAGSQAVLIVARAVQGVGGAVVSAVALSLIMNLFTEDAERAKAMGVYGFVCAGGGSLGVLVGGFLTHALHWHWVFLVNLPIGLAVFAACARLLPEGRGRPGTRLDLAGAATITLSLLLAVYAVIDGNSAGWTSPRTLGLLGAAVALFAVFLVVEARADAPLMPLGIFRNRNLSVANVVGTLWAAGMFAWFFIAALYLQQVLRYTPLEVGLAFLPANLIMAVFSIGLSARMVTRWGIRLPLALGLLLAAVGLGLFAQAPVDGRFLPHVLPAMLLLGLGAGMALNPVLLAAMSDVGPQDSGLASGIVNTAFMMGGALGLAVLASVAAARTAALPHLGTAAALTAGYQLAMGLGALAALAGAAIAAVGIRPPAAAPTGPLPQPEPSR